MRAQRFENHDAKERGLYAASVPVACAAPIHRTRFCAPYWPLLCLLLLGFARMASSAALVITNVSVVNVTPSSFSVVWATSPSATPFISVFADPGGTSNLAGQVGVQFYPLHTGDPALTNAYSRRLEQTVLRQKTKALGLVDVQVSDCSPGTTYYYRLQVTNSIGQQATWPASGPLPAVTTALENAFVVQSRQLVLNLPGLDPSGSIVLLSNSNTPSLLAAVAGDGVASNEVYFSVEDLIAAAGGTNYLPTGTQEFTAQVLGLTSSNVTSGTFTLAFTTDFIVGQESQLFFGEFLSLNIGSAIALTGTSNNIPINAYASGVTNLHFVLGLHTNNFRALSLQATAPQVGSAVLQPVSSNMVSITLNAASGQALVNNQQVAQINFTVASNQPSAILPLVPQTLQALGADGLPVTQLAAQAGQLVIVGTAPLLQASVGPNRSRNLVLYGIPWDSYQIQSSTNLSNPRAWVNAVRIPMTNILQAIGVDSSQPSIFYRAYQFVANPPLLEAHLAGQNRSILTYGQPGTNYTLQYTTNLSPVVAWHPFLSYTLTNSFQWFTNLGQPTNPIIFYRVQRH